MQKGIHLARQPWEEYFGRELGRASGCTLQRFFLFRIEINEVSPALLRTVVRTKKKNRLKTALIETAWKNVLQNLSGPDRPQANYQGRVVRSQRPVP